MSVSMSSYRGKAESTVSAGRLKELPSEALTTFLLAKLPNLQSGD